MSEGNKLPALSLEVKSLNDSTMKWYSVTFEASRFFSGREETRSTYLRGKGNYCLSLSTE